MRPKLTTLRTRLLLVYLGLIVVGYGGLTLLAGRQITQYAYDDFANSLQLNAFLVASNLVEVIEEGNRDDIERLIEQDASHLQADIVILNRQGQWVAGSYAHTNFNNMPEVMEAARNQITYDIRSNEQGIETLYTATPIRYENGEILGYVQLSAPTSIPQAQVQQRWLALITGFVVFSVMGLVIVGWLISTMTRPLSHLKATALQLAMGDLSKRVTDSGQDEISAVGHAFNQMADKVEAMIIEQRAFASNAAHELRTPLTTIRLRTEGLLADTLDTTTKTQYITEIDQEVARLGGLVDDLILLSRLDANQLKMGQEHVDLGRMVRRLQQEFAPLAQEKSIELNWEMPAVPLPTIQVNLNHLQVVWRNLLDNALKYTPKNGQVIVKFEHLSQYIGWHIIDTGIGISQENLPNIGKRFYRADKAHSRQIQGVGLGLSLVKSIIELYGGKFEITSQGLQQGSTASVYWLRTVPNEEFSP